MRFNKKLLKATAHTARRGHKAVQFLNRYYAEVLLSRSYTHSYFTNTYINLSYRNDDTSLIYVISQIRTVLNQFITMHLKITINAIGFLNKYEMEWIRVVC